MKQSFVYTIDDLSSVVETLKKMFKNCRIITFSGPLGAGKTTLIKQLLRSLGVKEPVTSPTFTYVNLYHTEAGQQVYHFDLYKIKNVPDFMQSGFHEYLYQPDSLVLIEWPESIEPLLVEGVCRLEIAYHENPSKRHVSVTVNG